MNVSEAMFYESNLTSDFRTNTVCLLVNMASKTVIRPILQRRRTPCSAVFTHMFFLKTYSFQSVVRQLTRKMDMHEQVRH